MPARLPPAARRDDDDTVRVRGHDEFADVEPGHDGLARARIVRQHEAQRLARQQGLIDRRDLMGQRLDVRAVHGHHGVEQESEVDALGLAGKLEGGCVAVEGEGPLGGRDLDRRLIIARAQALLDRTIGGPVDELERAFAVRHGRHDRHDLTGLDAG